MANIGKMDQKLEDSININNINVDQELPRLLMRR